MNSTQLNNQAIGVFDSGVGGLTVLRALQQALPHESFIYLGDTARLPYGIKSPETVSRYARQAVQVLCNRGVKMIVIACNTASAFALQTLQQEFTDIPIINVIEPGAAAACQASKSGNIAVIATEGTVANRAYENAILRLRPDANVISQSCSLFVALAEEGWVEGPIAEAIAERYLRDLFLHPDSSADCLVLGCTHFPILGSTISKVLGQQITVVDSASTTAQVVANQLATLQLQRTMPNGHHPPLFLATDSPQRFVRTAAHFLQYPLALNQIELVDL